MSIQSRLRKVTKGLCPLLLGGFIMLPAQAQSTRTNYIELDGKSQYLSIPYHPTLDIPLGESRTISLWLWGNSTMIYGEPMRLLSRRDIGKADSLNRSGYELVALRKTTDGFLGANLSDGAGRLDQALKGWATATDAHLFAWHHVALVIDRWGDSMKLYVDGLLVKEQSKGIRAWLTSNQLPLFIGAGQKEGKPTAFFNGRLDNIRFYSKALSAEEIQQDKATESVDPKQEGLILAFDFDNYHRGESQLTDATGRYTAQLHNYPARLSHKQVRVFTEHKTNASLIGRGAGQALREFELGLEKPAKLQCLKLSLSERAHQDVQAFRLYATDNGDRYDHRSKGILIAEGKPSAEGEAILKGVRKAPEVSSVSKLWLVADIKLSATEGNKLSTKIEAIELEGADVFRPESQNYEHEIVLERTLIWTPGENKSAHYRIPAIVRLNNGTLVASADRRKTTDYDLPSDIDVEVKISRDNGKTWSAPIVVAKGTPEHGFGDAAMTTDGKNIYMVMVAGSGLWFYPQSAKKPLEMFYTASHDGGRTWLPVREITQEVYTDRYPNGGFFGSGNGIITSKGRIAFVAAMRINEKWGGQLDNVMVYSDDQGKTWHASPVARTNGDEAKILELSNGDLVISSRNRQRHSPRTYVISSDHGMTWSKPQVWSELVGNNCNAALTRYSLEREGRGAKDIILHTLLDSPNRENLRIYMSEDEGKSWPYANTICTGEAAYSEVVRLSDGTIGIISEEDDRPAYDIYFTRVSLDWIRRGGGASIPSKK